jgi:hypothetical protein
VLAPQVVDDEYSKSQVASFQEPTRSAEQAGFKTKRAAPENSAKRVRSEEGEGAGEKAPVPASQLHVSSGSWGEYSDSALPQAKQPEKIKAPPEMSFCLRWDQEHDIATTKFYALEKPYLRTSSAITVLHLKKYLIQKYSLKRQDTAPLRFRCRGVQF